MGSVSFLLTGPTHPDSEPRGVGDREGAPHVCSGMRTAILSDSHANVLVPRLSTKVTSALQHALPIILVSVNGTYHRIPVREFLRRCSVVPSSGTARPIRRWTSSPATPSPGTGV